MGLGSDSVEGDRLLGRRRALGDSEEGGLRVRGGDSESEEGGLRARGGSESEEGGRRGLRARALGGSGGLRARALGLGASGGSESEEGSRGTFLGGFRVGGVGLVLALVWCWRWCWCWRRWWCFRFIQTAIGSTGLSFRESLHLFIAIFLFVRASDH